MKRSFYNEYKESGIDWLGRVPVEWDIVKLKFVSDVYSSNVDKHTKEDEIPVKLCNYVDVYYNDFITDDLLFSDGSVTVEEKQKFGLQRGDIILTKDSESWDDIAIPSFVSENVTNLVCGYHLALIRPNIYKLHSEYLYRCLTSEVYNYQFQIAANGITRYGLPLSAIENAIFAVPSIEIQKRICNYLKSEDERIYNIIDMLGGKESIGSVSENSMIGKLVNYRRNLINLVVTGLAKVNL